MDLKPLAKCIGPNNYRFHSQVHLRYPIPELYKKCATEILVMIEAPTVGNTCPNPARWSARGFTTSQRLLIKWEYPCHTACQEISTYTSPPRTDPLGTGATLGVLGELGIDRTLQHPPGESWSPPQLPCQQ